MSYHTRKRKSHTKENKTLATIASAVVLREFSLLTTSLLDSFDGSERVDAFRKIAKLARIKAEDIESEIRTQHEKRMGVSLAHLSLHKGMWVRRVHTKM
jgi:hypothetical protein